MQNQIYAALTAYCLLVLIRMETDAKIAASTSVLASSIALETLYKMVMEESRKYINNNQSSEDKGLNIYTYQMDRSTFCLAFNFFAYPLKNQ